MGLQLSLYPHTVKTNKAGTPIGLTINPYLRLAIGPPKDDPTLTVPPVFIQSGVFFSEGGQQLEDEDVPDWVWAELKKCSPASLVEVGYKGPVGK